MVFVTAGMGGGTGTGAAPVISKICKEKGILTVGVVTKPFNFEGEYRMKLALEGIEELQKHVDTLIIIPNQNLFHKATEKTSFIEAFKMVDNVLYSGIKSITDLMLIPGLINLDFADVYTVMSNMNKAMMGTGEASGEKRALKAAEIAISNPLLDIDSMKGAKAVLISVSGGLDMGLHETDEAAGRIKDELDSDARVIFGASFDENLGDKIRVSVVATGLDSNQTTNEFKLKNEDTSVEAPQEEKEDLEENNSSNFVNSIPIKPDDLQNIDYSANILDGHNNDNIDLSAPNIIDSTENKSNDLKIKEQLSDNLKKIKTEENLIKNNEEIYENFIEDTGGKADNEVEENNTDSNDKEVPATIMKKKKTSAFKKIINLFKENKEDNIIEDSADLSLSSEKDLVFSEDLLNIPTFIRDKKQKNEE